MAKLFWSCFLLIPLSIVLITGCGGGPAPISPDQPIQEIPDFTPPVPDIKASLPEAVGPLKISVLSVGQADAIYLQMPNGLRVLVDGGLGDDVVYRLKSLGVWKKQLDLVVLTHPHSDHIGGLLYVLNGCPIKRVWETGVKDTLPNPWYEAWKYRVRKLGIAATKVKAGQKTSFGGVTLEVLAPLVSVDGKLVDEVNNTSIVILVSYGSCKALLMADALIQEQRQILAKLGPVQMLKVPHHGASNAALEDTYQRTKPDTAVFTTGWSSSLTGIPSNEALSLARKYCRRQFSTFHDGTVTATMDGRNTTITVTPNR